VSYYDRSGTRRGRSTEERIILNGNDPTTLLTNKTFLGDVILIV
jgi:hypothetical protein